ncbi:MAG: tRNA uracil 4-sulfurtransferase ThiI [Sphaerochaetaceae bacterium]
MEYHLYLVKLGEISLKGLNRDFFEKRLKQNIKAKLRPYHSQFTSQKGRLFIRVDPLAPFELVQKAITTSFGVVGVARALVCAKEMNQIIETALTLSTQGRFAQGCRTFKVESVRSDKSFPLTSYQISSTLGHHILEAQPHLKVDVKKPDCTLYVEIRDKAYLYASFENGPGGLPVGTAGRALTLLSGGIDSPVAAYMMAKRGLRQEAVYFHAYPYTSDEAKEKVKKLATILSPYLGGVHLHIIPFTNAQLHLKANGAPEEQTLLMRAAMMSLSCQLALERRCAALVTGEALSQVASQTLESLAFTNSVSNLLVFRPLVGMDKQEIVHISRTIGTYETSILPYDDCCTIFSPKHPLVRPNSEKLHDSYQKLAIEPLLQEALENRETVKL